MKPLSVLYLIRVVLGISAALICALYNYFFGFSFTISDLFRGLTISIAFYILTYYVLKQYFLDKVEKPRKLLSTGVGAYFVTWIVIWSLLSTVLVNETNIIFAVNGFNNFELKTTGNAYANAGGLLWANSSEGNPAKAQAVKGVLPHGAGGATSLASEINVWRDTETLPDVFFLQLNLSEVSVNVNTTEGYIAFGVALWLALDEPSYMDENPQQLVIRFQNVTRYENRELVETPSMVFDAAGVDYQFNFSLTGIHNGFSGLIEIDLGQKFKQVFEKTELSSVMVAKLKAVEIYIATSEGFLSTKIEDIQVYLKGLSR